jgi:ubiquinone/menaquinone biosynthesis C-methylase UbiE
MTVQEQQQVRDAWENIAARYDEFVTPLNTVLAEQALPLAELRPGMRVLDVAAGSGALSIPAARLGAHVVATDIAPTMIERLTARTRAEGLNNLEGLVMDGYALDLDDDTFDVAGSQNGVSLFPDVKRGLAELVRVTKPGGRVLIVAFGALQRAEFLSFLMGAIKAAVPGFTGIPMDPPPLPFQLADPDKLRQELGDAGLTDVRVETVTWQMEFPSATHFLDWVPSSNPIGAGLVAGLTEEQKSSVQQVLDGMLRERSGGYPGAVLNTEINIGIGTK